MKRYSQATGGDMEEYERGEWVRFEDVKVRIDELEDALNDIFHRTSSTTSQMEIIERVLPQRVQ